MRFFWREKGTGLLRRYGGGAVERRRTVRASSACFLLTVDLRTRRGRAEATPFANVAIQKHVLSGRVHNAKAVCSVYK